MDYQSNKRTNTEISIGKQNQLITETYGKYALTLGLTGVRNKCYGKENSFSSSSDEFRTSGVSPFYQNPSHYGPNNFY
jgi:hypothetical protein